MLPHSPTCIRSTRVGVSERVRVHPPYLCVRACVCSPVHFARRRVRRHTLRVRCPEHTRARVPFCRVRVSFCVWVMAPHRVLGPFLTLACAFPFPLFALRTCAPFLLPPHRVSAHVFCLLTVSLQSHSPPCVCTRHHHFCMPSPVPVSDYFVPFLSFALLIACHSVCSRATLVLVLSPFLSFSLTLPLLMCVVAPIA